MCLVNGKSVNAVVDSAADVTIISEELYNALVEKPQVLGNEVMKLAADNKTFLAKKVGPITLQVKHKILYREIFVAPIHDYMLLGLDVLRDINARLDFGGSTDKDVLSCRNVSVTGDGLSREKCNWASGGETGSLYTDTSTIPGFVDKELESQYDDTDVKKSNDDDENFFDCNDEFFREVVLDRGTKIPPFSEMVFSVNFNFPYGTKTVLFEPSRLLPVLAARSIQKSLKKCCY